ncbi:MAG: hypothetical protein AAAFM81_02585 [Pseudomonadota bacterium]
MAKDKVVALVAAVMSLIGAEAIADADICQKPNTVIALAPNSDGYRIELLEAPPPDYTVYQGAAAAALQSLLREFAANPSGASPGLGLEVQRRLNSEPLKQSLDSWLLATTDQALAGSTLFKHCDVDFLSAPADSDDERLWVSEQFDTVSADTILLLRVDALLETSMDRVRVTVTQKQYERRRHRSGKKAKPREERQVSYLSAPRAIDQRAYLDGEKAEEIEALETELAATVDPETGKRSRAAKLIERKLEVVRDSETVPAYVAVAESWGSESVAEYTPALIDHLSLMLRLVWDEPDRPANFRQSAVRFRFRSTIDNDNMTSRGVVVREHEGHDIYRNFKDYLFSVPSDFGKRYATGELIPR